MDFYVNGVRIRESTGMTCKTRAREVYDKRKQGLKDGLAGIKKQQQPNLRSVASEEWLELKKTTLAPRSVAIKKADLQRERN